MKRKGSDTGWLSVQRLLNRGFLVEPSRPQNRISDTLISKAHGTSVSRFFSVVCSRMRLPRVPTLPVVQTSVCESLPFLLSTVAILIDRREPSTLSCPLESYRGLIAR